MKGTFGEMLATVRIYQTLEGKESTFGEILAANTSRMRVSHI
ncbi:hypothetical protein [Dokdonia sp. Asnod1-B02]